MEGLRRFALAMALSLLHVALANAQEYPNRAIRLVVAQTAGTPQDTVIRIVGPSISQLIGQPVVIENKPGAGNIIGFEYVARQMPADGYTWVSALVPDLALMPLTFKQLRFDPLKDLPPVISFIEARASLASSTLAPWKTFQEMIAQAKANPGKFNYGAPNAYVRFSVAAVLQAAGVNMTFIPYNAAGPFALGLAGGDIQLAMINASSTLIGEKVRVVAVTGEGRGKLFPDVPSLVELGMPNIPGTRYSLNVRAGTPQAIVEKIESTVIAALQLPAVKAAYEKANQEIVILKHQEAAKELAAQAKLYADTVQKLGYKPE